MNKEYTPLYLKLTSIDPLTFHVNQYDVNKESLISYMGVMVSVCLPFELVRNDRTIFFLLQGALSSDL